MRILTQSRLVREYFSEEMMFKLRIEHEQILNEQGVQYMKTESDIKKKKKSWNARV